MEYPMAFIFRDKQYLSAVETNNIELGYIRVTIHDNNLISEFGPAFDFRTNKATGIEKVSGRSDSENDFFSAIYSPLNTIFRDSVIN